MLPIQFSHLDAVGSGVSPVQVLPQPVHCHALRIVQAELHHMFQGAAVHEGPTDGLHSQNQNHMSAFRILSALTAPLPHHTHLQSDVRPVDTVVCNIKVQRRRLLDASQRDGHVVVVGLQGDSADVSVAGKQQEGLGYDAGPHVCDELQTDGTAALNTQGLVEAEVAAAAVVLGTWVCPWKYESQLG